MPFSSNGPRGAEIDRDADRNDYENLVLLCGTHHALVDAQPHTYTEGVLHEWKVALEQRVSELIAEGMRTVRFPQLRQVCDAIVSGNVVAESSPLAAPALAEKLKWNGLGPRTAQQIRLGLAQTPQVDVYLSQSASFQPALGQQLRGAFLREYEQLRNAGATGDELFDGLYAFAVTAGIGAADNSAERVRLGSAALAVMTYLFQICEVFEGVPDVDAE